MPGEMEFDFALILDDALNKLPLNDVTLPWEQGIWREIFQPQAFCVDPSQKFTRPTYLEPPEIATASADGDNKRRRTVVNLVSGWVDIVRPGTDIHWEEECEAKMQVALKRWLEACLMMPRAVGLRQMLEQQVDVQSQLRLLRNLLWRKAPGTLVKRVNSLFRYLTYLHEVGSEFPASESLLYQFLVEQQDKAVAPTRLAGVLESLDIPELAILTSSRRCSGAAATKRGGVRKQASPFTVAELQVLHKVVCSIDENLWDRIFCGTVLMMVYTRSRWSDLQRAESMIIDRDCSGVLRFLECIVSSHKCVHSAAFRNVFLHAVAPCQGITEDTWAECWLSCRASMDLELGRLPLLPAPNTSGVPTKRPLSSEEMKLWTRHILTRFGCDLSGRRITSHSCKSTLLSYAAKHGVGWDDRLVLGGHLGHLKSAITYSRDALAKPLSILNDMLADIRRGYFRPDETRSGRFTQQKHRDLDASDSVGSWEHVGAESNLQQSVCPVVSNSVETSNLVTVSDEEEVKVEAGDIQDVGGILDCSSEEDVDCTDSSSDESAGEGCPTKRLVKPPTAPAGFSLIQHSKLKTLHLLPQDRERVLACGRSRTKMHIDVDLKVRWDTPCCHVCWKKTRQS